MSVLILSTIINDEVLTHARDIGFVFECVRCRGWLRARGRSEKENRFQPFLSLLTKASGDRMLRTTL
jgi:hypothetical protein